jgi:hypothetical protein
MKLKNTSSRRGAANLLDLFIMLLAVAIVAAIFVLPRLARSRARASRINCVNNLKQVGLSFRLWSGDNGDKMPAQVSTNEGGTMELVGNGGVFPHFSVMSNELSTPKILICPNDSRRTAATNFTNLRDGNISYFVVPEADETIPEMWLSGDRNLAANGVAFKRGLHTLTTNQALGWTAQIHTNYGNLGLADGSVQQPSNARLQPSFTNALRAYYSATTNVSFRIAIP